MPFCRSVLACVPWPRSSKKVKTCSQLHEATFEQGGKKKEDEDKVLRVGVECGGGRGGEEECNGRKIGKERKGKTKEEESRRRKEERANKKREEKKKKVSKKEDNTHATHPHTHTHTHIHSPATFCSQ